MKSLADIATRTIRTADGKAESRKKLMGAVMAACRRIGLDTESRRDLQLGVTGKASMADMTPAELGKLLDRLNRDWKGPDGHRAHLGKIRALWWSLFWLGEIDDPRDRAISAFVRRQTGISALKFLDHRHAAAVVEALKSWGTRAGVSWPTPGGTADPLGDRRAVLNALWLRRCDQAGRVGRELRTELGRAVGPLLGDRPDPDQWTAHEIDAAIRHIGKAVRHAAGKRNDRAGA